MEKEKYNTSLIKYCRFILINAEKYNLFSSSDLLFRRHMLTVNWDSEYSMQRFYREVNWIIKDWADEYALWDHTFTNKWFYELWIAMQNKFTF